MKDGKFEIGDIIRGKENNCGITNEDMTMAEVIDISSDNEMRIEVLSTRNKRQIDKIGHTFIVVNSTEYFELVKESDKITTEEVFEWFANAYCKGDGKKFRNVFGINALMPVLSQYTTHEIVEMIKEQIRAEKNTPVKKVTIAELEKLVGGKFEIIEEDKA